MTPARSRPLSPHLTIWRWGPHMAASIAHRVCGVGLATVGVAGFVWWLAALAAGPEAYAVFLAWAKWPPALIVPIGLSFIFFLHLANGVRHLLLDTGAGYELKVNRVGAIIVLAAPFVLTALMWAYILLGRG